MLRIKDKNNETYQHWMGICLTVSGITGTIFTGLFIYTAFEFHRIMSSDIPPLAKVAILA